MQEQLSRLVQSRVVQNLITAVIVLAAVLVGVETYPSMVAAYGHVLHRLDQLILAIFLAEIALKIGACGAKPWRYFADPWIVFDFIVVAVCFMPFDTQGIAVLRLVRLLRVLKLVRAVPELQVLVSAVLKSIPSMGYVTLLLMLLFYVYGIAATTFFGANDPVHFGTLEISLVSLFRTATLEGWTELMYTQMFGCDVAGYADMEAACVAPKAQPVLAVSYFFSFVLIGTMVVMNLFVGVIMNGIAEAQKEQREQEREERAGQAATLESEIDALHGQLAAIQEQLGRIQKIAQTRG